MKKLCCLLLSALWLASPTPLYSQAEQPRELFSQAHALFSQGNIPQAEELFTKTLEQNYLLADYSLYFLGLAASSRNAWDNARNHFQQLKQRFPQSLWSSYASLELAKISLAEKNYSQALAELQALRKRAARNEVFNEALYTMGKIHELQDDLKQAYSLYQESRRAAGNPWAAKARDEVKRLREQHRQLFPLTSPEELSDEGALLVGERQYQEAEGIYRRLLDLASERRSRLRFLMNMADLYRAARKREDEITALTEIVREYPEGPEAPGALYRLARVYWNRNENLKALDHLKQLKERYPRSPIIENADFISAQIHESLRNTNEARSVYEGFAARFPGSRLRQEAEWRLAWLYYLNAEHSLARPVFKRLAEDAAAGHYKTAALYWEARAAEKLGYTEEAKRIYQEIVNGEEDSYYIGPAAKRLQNMGVGVKEKKPTKSPSSPEATPRLNSHLTFHLARAKELAESKLHRLAIAELDEIKDRSSGEASLRAILMREYARNRAYDRSVALANELDPSREEAGRYRYPLAYWETIEKKAEQQDMDPYLIVALIRQESLFDPSALSPASAYGLMQLLPSTAVRAAGRLGLPPPPAEKLFDPELNLTLGIHHLKEMLRLYSNSVVKALAAYNAGENAVARWESQIRAEDEEEFIERIPYGETRLYIKLVLRNHLNYKRIYDAGDKRDEKAEKP